MVTIHKDGSNKKTMVVPLKLPYPQPSFKKQFPEIWTTKNFRRTKHCILQELQLNFQRKAFYPLTNYHQLKVKYSL